MNVEPKTPWKGKVRDVMRRGDEQDLKLCQYYRDRQDGAPFAAFVVGISILLCGILYAAIILSAIMRPM